MLLGPPGVGDPEHCRAQYPSRCSRGPHSGREGDGVAGSVRRKALVVVPTVLVLIVAAVGVVGWRTDRLDDWWHELRGDDTAAGPASVAAPKGVDAPDVVRPGVVAKPVAAGRLSRAKVAADDLLWADAVVCYSYGMASWKHIGHRLQKAWPAGKRYKIACVVAGVPDFAYAQFYGNLWHLWDWVDKGRCWQVDAIPASAALGNAGYRWVGAGEPIPADVRWVNINCNQLVAGLNPVGRHTHIQTNPTVLAQIRAEINKAA